MEQIWWHDKVGYKINKNFFTIDEKGCFDEEEIKKKMDYMIRLGADCILMAWNPSWKYGLTEIFNQAEKRRISIIIGECQKHDIISFSCPKDHFYRQSAYVTLCLLQHGMPVIVQGQEIGLFDEMAPISWDRVELYEQEYGSILNFTRRLISFRKSAQYKEIFTYGSFRPIYEVETKIRAYERSLKNKSVQVICNYSDENVDLLLKEDYINIIFVNYEQVSRIGNTLKLKPYQIVVVELFISEIIFSDFLTKF